MSTSSETLRVVFIHLDLGIGGAEQLVLQLATASQDSGHEVSIATTRCEQNHCFDAVKLESNGRLARCVSIHGNWIPPTIASKFTALCSSVRMMYLGWKVCRSHADADVIVLDVLPTPIPMLLQWLPSAGILFYCHFPDKLLLQSSGGSAKQQYRKLLDTLEESTMASADTLVVNSAFTLKELSRVFLTLRDRDVNILHPAFDSSNATNADNKPKTAQSPIVSLNRFERKKNIGLLIEACALLKQRLGQTIKLPKVIIAGGYDTSNVENVEHYAELQALVQKLNLSENVEFQLDISDETRSKLFQVALCVVYTPDKEHFGIVPLEAMYAGTPVLAVNSGGPTETVVDSETGFLRDPTPEAFSDALEELLKDPQRATTMGKQAKAHVEESFSAARFQKQWNELLFKTVQQRKARLPSTSVFSILIVCIVSLLACIVLATAYFIISSVVTPASHIGEL